MKLTKVQREFLAECAEGDGATAVEHYAPARRLLKAGLVDVTWRSLGAAVYRATPAGIEALRATEATK